MAPPAARMGCRADERRIRLPPATEAPGPDLVAVEPRYLAVPTQPVRLHRAAYAAYRQMKAAAEADGLPRDVLTVTSGYRSSLEQRPLWEDALRRYGTQATKYVAPPGSSPHQTGRAIDLWLGVRFGRDPRNIPAIAATPAHQWLLCNAARFGFTPYLAEPWHWEYNPPGAVPALPRPAPFPVGDDGRTLDEAWRRGYRHPNALTDILFHARHPERRGRPLSSTEAPLVSEWVGIRDRIVRQFLAGRAARPGEGPLREGYR